MRYLEYETATGRIISELTSRDKPTPSEGFSLLEIPEDADIDTTLYAVKNGVLVKCYETNEERLERERLKREHLEKVRMRMKAMMYEVGIALLEEDDNAIKQLRQEYRELKAYL
ncbi:MAG: hypothetical protein IJS28_07435 [Synergistaceae bacterium]|nr:hypothetical protein [Synergistaceae bacterium]